MNRKILHIFLWLLVLGQATSIFWFSSQPSSASQQQSGQVARAVAAALTPGFDALPRAAQDRLVEDYQHRARKAAHGIEFAALAGTIALALHRQAWKRAAAWAVGASGLYAVVDELHQLGVAGRSALAGDVLIDLLGAIVGAALALLLLALVRRRRAIREVP